MERKVIETKYYDSHTIFINCDTYTAEQINECLSASLKQYDETISCDFYVNLLENRDNISYKKAFVFISNTGVYHMILGRNFDGSDRVEYTDDSQWIAPPYSPPRSRSNSKDISINMEWSLLIEIEEEKERLITEHNTKHTCPKIVNILNKLINLPDDLICEASYVTPIDQNLSTCILKCHKVPNGINYNDIKKKFSPFASDINTLHSRKNKGKHIQESYPFVTITKDHTAYITFDSDTKDAQFALHMTKKTKIKNMVLYFVHARKNDIF